MASDAATANVSAGPSASGESTRAATTDPRLTVAAGAHTIQGRLARPADDGSRPPTGIYSFSVDRPYDPADYGLHGYTSDLGVLMRHVIIRVEPGAPSVPH